MVISDDTGWRAFISFIQEYFSFEFMDLDKQYKNKIIEEVLLNNQEYITKEDVMAEDLCDRCGECCRTLHCPHFDYDTNLCPRHDNQLMNLCREYPWGGEFGIQPLTLNCRYQTRFFIKWFTLYFEKAMEIKEGNNE